MAPQKFPLYQILTHTLEESALIARCNLVYGLEKYEILCYLRRQIRGGELQQQIIDFKITNITDKSVPEFRVMGIANDTNGQKNAGLQLALWPIAIGNAAKQFNTDIVNARVRNSKGKKISQSEIANELEQDGLGTAIRVLHQALRYGYLRPTENPEKLVLNSEKNCNVILQLAEMLQIKVGQYSRESIGR